MKMSNVGYGSNGAPFEYSVSIPSKIRSKRRLLLLGLYAAFLLVFVVGGAILRFMLPLLCFTPLLLWIICFFTWKWCKEEIKLSFFTGAITMIRMYDAKNPKELCSKKIKEMISLEKASSELLEKEKGKKLIFAAESVDGENVYIALWDDCCLVFEAVPKALEIIKYYR
jgi:hypothetical protein